MAIQGFFTGDVKIKDLNGVLKAVDGIVEVATDAGTVTSVGIQLGSTGTDANVANSPITSSGNITLNLPTASATNRGLLSSADWTTFNNKQAAGNYVTLDTYQTITASKTFSVGFNLASVGGTNQPTFFENTNNLHSGSVGSNIFGFNTNNNIYFGKGSDNGGVLSWNNSEVRYYTLPNANGTIALVGGSGVGTVTSIATTGPITGGTITSTGTIGITQATTSTDGYLSSTDWNTFNSKQAALTFSAPLINTSGTISIPAATSSVNGYLSSADWDTFNNKQAALSGTGFVKISGTTISYDNSTYYLASNPSSFITLIALSATAPLSYSNTTGVFSISQATTSTDGYLSSTDWNTFNNKQAAGSYITALTGEATASGPGSASVTLSTSAVTGKLLTGLNLTGGGTIAATDSILQAFGKVQNQISGLAGGVTYQGTWNASTNTPTLTSSVGTKGYYYIVDVAGSTNLNGITDWKIGDWAIFNGSTWDKVDNTDAVSSVNGFTGAVSLTTSNISEGTNLYYLDSRARLALSFTAGSGAYDNTTGVITIPTNTSQLTNGANFITLSSLSASSPLAYNSGTGAFSIQVATSSQNGYLSSTDWTTFNSKQPAGNYVTTDTTQTITALKTFTAKVVINTGGTDDQIQLVGTAPSVRLTNAATGATINGFVAMSGGANNYIQGSVSGDMTIGNQNNGKILFGFGSGTATQKMSLDSSGNAVLSGGLTLGSTLSNGTYTYTLPSATGTLALTSDIPSLTGYVPYTGATANVNLGTYSLSAYDLIIDHTSGSGVAASITKGGNGEALTVVKSSGSGNAASITGGVTLLSELHLTTDLADAYIASATNWNTAYSLRITSATSPLSITSNVISIAQASGSTDGYLSSTDWTTFNNKQNALTNPVTGTGTTNYLPKFTGASTIGNSQVFDNGTNVGIGTASVSGTYEKLAVAGGISIKDNTNAKFEIGRYNTTGAQNSYIKLGANSNSLRITNNTDIADILELTNSGNLGLGVTPSAWVDFKAFELPNIGFLAAAGPYIQMIANGVYNGGANYIYKTSAQATMYAQAVGQHQWFIAPSGTAGNTFTFTQAMTLGSNSGLSIGDTAAAPSNGLLVNGNASMGAEMYRPTTDSYLRLNGGGSGVDGASVLMFGSTHPTVAGQLNIAAVGSGSIIFSAGGGTRLTIASTGAATFSSSVTAASTLYLGDDGTYGSTYKTLGLTGTTNGTHRIFAGTSDNLYIAAATGRSISFWTDGSSGTKMFINTVGNVGIGTTSPSYKLDVSASINDENVIRSINTNAGNLATARVYVQNDSGSFGQFTSYSSGFGFNVFGTNAANYTALLSSGASSNGLLIGALTSDPVIFGTDGTERMRITSGGNVGIGSTGYSGIKLQITSATSDSSSFALSLANSSVQDLFYVRSDGYMNTGSRASSPYNLTSGNAANMVVGADGTLYRSTSSLKYKNNVRDYDKGLDIINQMRPVYYNGINDGNTLFAGLIAEEIHALGLTEFVQYAKDGTPDALSYPNMIALLVKGIKELKQELDTLKNK